MKSSIGGTILIVGLIMLLIALAMPATSTQTSRTCYDSPLSYGQSCATTTYEAPNTGRFSAFGIGVFLSLLGAGIVYSDSTSSGSSQIGFNVQDSNNSSESSEVTEKSDTYSNKDKNTLAEVVEKNTSNKNSRSDDDKDKYEQ